VSEVRFHHLERRRVDQALPRLLERALEEGRRVVVRASSEEMVAALNERLWTYDDASFLPHGAGGDGDPMTQPIFLTSELENPNAATMLVRLSGAEAVETDDAFDLIVLMFDGRDEAALAEARSEWRRLKDQGRAISYWRESDEGGWERVLSIGLEC
jgi:DNA polymerase III subunit chi